MVMIILIYSFNQKLIAAFDTLDSSTLADKLIKNHKVDYLFSKLIPAEAVDNDQEHLVARRYSII